jgi:hypothetical protein
LLFLICFFVFFFSIVIFFPFDWRLLIVILVGRDSFGGGWGCLALLYWGSLFW